MDTGLKDYRYDRVWYGYPDGVQPLVNKAPIQHLHLLLALFTTAPTSINWESKGLFILVCLLPFLLLPSFI
jgi:hypothetical protein